MAQNTSIFVDDYPGIFASSVPGLHKIPLPQVLEFKNLPRTAPQLEKPIKAIPSTHSMPSAVAKSRMVLGDLRLSFTLSAYRKGALAHQEDVGRTWSSSRACDIAWLDGTSWEDHPVALHPGVAGLSADILDRHALAALGNITRLFGDVKPEHISTESRAAIRGLPRMATSHFRLLCRYASLYLAAAIAEANQGKLSYQGTNSPYSPPQIMAVNSMAQLNALLGMGYSRGRNVLYLENLGLATFSADLAEVAVAVASEAPIFTTSSGPVPASLAFWPSCQEPIVAIMHDTPKTDFTPGVLHSANIWDAAVVYSRQHGCLDEFQEALLTVAAFTWRPAQCDGIMGFNKLLVALPPLATQTSALGPLLMSTRVWEARTGDLPMPMLHDIAADGCIRHASISLAWQTILMDEGLRDALHQSAPGQMLRSLKKFCLSQHQATPALHRVAGLLERIGVPEALGRSLAHLSINLTAPAALNNFYKNNFLLQWEEMLPFFSTYPASANIQGLLRPVMLKSPDVYGLWASVASVTNRMDTADALYSLRVYGELQYGLLTQNSRLGSTTIANYSPPTNYRGQLADSVFGKYHTADGAATEPIFKITNRNTLMAALGGYDRRLQWEWFIDWERDESFEGLLAKYASPPLPLAARAYPPPTHIAGVQANVSIAIPPAVPAPEKPLTGPPAPQGAGKATGPGMRFDGPAGVIVGALGILPNWIERIREAAVYIHDPSRLGDARNSLREAAGGLDITRPTELLSICTFQDRPKVAAAFRSLSNLAVDVGGQAKGVDLLPFTQASSCYSNLASGLKYCPALTAEEWTELAPTLKGSSLPSDDEIQLALQAGVSHGELAGSWASEQSRNSILAQINQFQLEMRAEAQQLPDAPLSDPPSPNILQAVPEDIIEPALQEENFGSPTSSPSGQPPNQPLSPRPIAPAAAFQPPLVVQAHFSPPPPSDEEP